MRVSYGRAARGSAFRKATCGPAFRYSFYPYKVADPRAHSSLQLFDRQCDASYERDRNWLVRCKPFLGSALVIRVIMSKLLHFLMASGMIVGGLYLLVAQLFFTPRWYIRDILVGAILLMLGAYLLPIESKTRQ